MLSAPDRSIFVDLNHHDQILPSANQRHRVSCRDEKRRAYWRLWV